MNKKQQLRLEQLLENTGDMALKRRAREIVEQLDPQNGDKILDVGCGDGYYLHLLSNLGLKLELTGCDFDEDGLKSARKNLKNKIRLVQADLMKKLPFENNSFDKIVMSEVAEHLPDDIKGLKEVRRVLKRGGILCLTVPNANYPMLWDPVNWIMEKTSGKHISSGFWAGLWYNHIRLYKPELIKIVMQKAGFTVEQIGSLTWWCLPFNHHLVNIIARLLWGGKLPTKIALSVNKYKSSSKRPLLISLGFGLVNLIDRLNDFYQPKNWGVGVMIKAVK